ncbi:MAG: right-handed parallel beta-helix repeat-containing protein, partial [Candidatus Thiodiazotropha sp.]
IKDNQWVGVGIYGSASAYIGLHSLNETIPSPNIIQNNGVDGIHVFGSSGAIIAGNSITSNEQQGVRIDRVSYAHVSSNLINSNGLSGVLVDGNSGVNLGFDEGLSILNKPNMTTVNNINYGFYCEHNSYVDGRIGTLDGDPGEKWFGAGCIDSLDNFPSPP